MNNLAKLFIVVSLFTISTRSFSQTFGIKAGLNLSDIFFRFEYGGQINSYDFKTKPGFNIGATAEIPINKVISFENVLLLSTKGYKNAYKTQYIDTKGTVNYLCLDLVVNSKISVNVGGIKIYGAFGPYIGIGISGKMKGEANEAGQLSSWSNKISWGSEPIKDFKRLDYGLSMGAGIEIHSVELGINYAFGLANLSPTGGNFKTINRVLGISLGYKF